MKKIGLICLAVVLTLGIAGVGFGWWSETLSIGQNPVNTGSLKAIFRDVVSNDDGAVDPWFCLDGVWLPNVDIGDDGGDPTAEQTMFQPVNRIDKVANTTVAGAWIMSGTYDAPVMPPTPPADLHKEITVSMANAYPSYHPTVFFNVINAGSIPAKVKAVKLVEVSVDGVNKTVSQELVVCTTYYVDAETGTITLSATPESDFSIHLSNDAGHLYDIYLRVYPDWPGTASGDLDIHVENGAKENTTYDFTVAVVVTQFNAP